MKGLRRLAVRIETLIYLELKLYWIIQWVYISLLIELHLLTCLIPYFIILLFICLP
jgi:hypothetical protein